MESILKAIYEWIPFDGKKTVIGIFVSILALIKMWYPDQPIIDTIIAWLNGLSGPEMLAIGGLGMAAGLHHKKLKAENS